jgi:hypothetical protein
MTTVASDLELERVYGDEGRNTACGGCAEEIKEEAAVMMMMKPLCVDRQSTKVSLVASAEPRDGGR